MRELVNLAARALRSAARRLDRIASWSPGANAKLALHERAVKRSAEIYDMVSQPDEPYYARQYLHWILPELTSRFPDRRAQVLDLGCGQGRLSLPLAEWCGPRGGTVTAVDFTPAAVAKARGYAAARGLGNVTFQEADLLGFLRGRGDASADAVLLTEVLYVLPSYREALLAAARVLRPGGVLFATFRSQYFNLFNMIRSHNWDGAETVAARREGHLGGPVWFTWQTPEEIRRLLSSSGLHPLSLRGIGVCSGIKDDPFASIATPSQLSSKEQESLMQIECAVAEPYAACGRYILGIAERRPT